MKNMKIFLVSLSIAIPIYLLYNRNSYRSKARRTGTYHIYSR